MTTSGTSISLLVVGTTDVKLWGLTLPDRLRKQFDRAGFKQDSNADKLVLVRADAVLDQPLIGALAQHSNLVLLSSDGHKPIAASAGRADLDRVVALLENQSETPLAGFTVQTPADVGASFWKALRKRETPYALQVGAPNIADIEWRMFMGTYKGATDLVTKHVWPRPAFFVTRWLATFGITPNMVTSLGAVATAVAFYWFLEGSFGVGLVAAWLMTFIDTVDGKLARTTLTSSKWGDVFDHGIDLIHPPFWYAAWAIGLEKAGFSLAESWFWPLMVVIVGGYVIQRLMEGVAIKWLGLEIHIWRRIDTLFRQVTARRNPNLLILSAFTIVGRPDTGLIAVAVWTLVCLVLHALQLLQALTARRASPDGLKSWMSEA